jgi:hypothetical protein
MERTWVRRWLWAAAVGWLPGALAALGCGQGAPFDIVPVHGKVTYEDGTPIPGHQVLVKFHPQFEGKDAKTQPRYAQAEVSKTGEFVEATTWKYGDGAIPGPHKVTVEALSKTYAPNGNVDPIYANPETTPLTAEVKASGDTFEFTVKKPKKIVRDN